MKFSINTKSFLSALTAVGRVVPAKASIQILADFLIEVKDGEIVITASDVENRATVTIQAITDGNGKFCIDAKFLLSVIRNLPDCLVTVATEENLEVAITTTKNTFNTVAQNADQYPDSDFNETPAAEFSLSTESLLAGLSEVLPAVGTDDFHPQMMGVCFDVKDDHAVFVATDTRRLIKSVKAEQTGAEVRCIIPPKAVSVVTGLVSKEPTVDIKVYPTAIRFSSDSFVMHAQLIKGNYPDYNRVIPQNNNIRATFSRIELLSAVRRVAACADSNYGVLRFNFALGEAVISTSDTSFNRSAKETIECDFGSNSMMIGLSAELLASLLSAVATDKVTFNMLDPSRPVVITGDGDEHLTMLLMPMNINA